MRHCGGTCGGVFRNRMAAENEATKNINDGGRRGSVIRSFWGQSSWAGGGNLGKIDQFIKLFFFLANFQNEIKSFDQSIDHPIAEVLPGGFCLNRKIRAAGPGKRLRHGCVLLF